MNTLVLKAIIGVLIAAAFMSVGALIDHHLYVVPIKATLDKQAGADLQASHDAIAEVKATTETQNANTVQSANSYADSVVRVNSAIERMRKHPTTHIEHLPSLAVRTGEPTESLVQPPNAGTSAGGSDCESTGSDPCTVVRAFFESGLKDAAAVEGYAEWVTSQHFPISKE